MRIPGADQAIGHLIKWSEKDEWAAYRRQVFAEHFELIMERFDISEQEIVDLLDEAFGMVCGFVVRSCIRIPATKSRYHRETVRSGPLQTGEPRGVHHRSAVFITPTR